MGELTLQTKYLACRPLSLKGVSEYLRHSLKLPNGFRRPCALVVDSREPRRCAHGVSDFYWYHYVGFRAVTPEAITIDRGFVRKFFHATHYYRLSGKHPGYSPR